MGWVHANAWTQIPGVEILAHDPHGATRLAGVPDPGSPAALLDACDIVDVCLPTDLHEEATIQALQAGKHVFLEKPAARTAAGAERIAEAARSAGRVLAVGLVVRVFPEYAQANRTVRSGQIGKPAACRMRRGGPAPSGVDRWFRDPARSGGILLDLAIHDFDWLRWTFGDPKRIYARHVRVEEGEHALSTLTFASGIVAHVESTWLDPAGFRTAFEVCGSDGMLEYDSRRSPSLRWSTSAGVSSEQCYLPSDDPYRRQLEAFLAATRGEGSPVATIEDAIAAQRICEAAIESAETGRVVEF
jgi:predicted dehydrogenase